MLRQVTYTGDGSPTIILPELNISYHSRYGALQESMHVFINTGLNFLMKKYETLKVYEMGFGTGLNALLTWSETIRQEQPTHYTSIEALPLNDEEVGCFGRSLNDRSFHQKLGVLYKCEWEKDVKLDEWFTLRKTCGDFANASITEQVHLIYYDAFDPEFQPELWTEQIFRKLFSMLYDNGILVTYSSKGSVRRAMITAGFKVEKLKGPPGKREMLRAVKCNTR